MRKITVVCVGNLKENYLKSGCDEYIKRLSKNYEIKIIEINESKPSSNNPSSSERQLIIENEGKQIIEKLKGFIICLCIEGKQYDSVSFADIIKSSYLNFDEITFVIGGSYGLSDNVKNKANCKLSFSLFTFPHQLMRLILLEQIYRANTIELKTPYHK
ncbi:MAG: 23S rRNA (pseudouridine(1915)-N(3))-methyltransferase RlmH [Clostridia bacterium]|nr:23S rRNA (pseudouridine(1915)-N(3))-methyltransferase RlmH [Clostridia bacterium]